MDEISHNDKLTNSWREKYGTMETIERRENCTLTLQTWNSMQLVKDKNQIKQMVTQRSLNFLTILGKNLVIFYKFSTFISEKIDSFYQNMFHVMCEKNNFLKFHTF